VRTRLRAVLALSLLLVAANPAYAKKDKHGKNKHEQVAHGQYFDERHRTVTHQYYDARFAQSKKCPPGLARKNNGCLPPGQAKKWQVGKPLPRDVVFHAVPGPLVAQLGQPPAGHRYVRVASDILLIAVGSRMVIDGLQDLGKI
jgi:Ni/Co efflux regulator RcnB